MNIASRRRAPDRRAETDQNVGRLEAVPREVKPQLRRLFSAALALLAAIRTEEANLGRGTWEPSMKAEVHRLRRLVLDSIQVVREVLGDAGCDVPSNHERVRETLRWITNPRERSS